MAGSTTNYGATKPATGEAYDVNIVNNNSDIWDTQIKNREKQALGRVHKSLGIVNSGAVSTLSVINNIPTFTFKAGREYSIVWDFQYYGSLVNAYFEFSIATCATTDSASLTTGLTYRNQRIRSTQEGGASFVDSGRVEAPVTFTVDTTLQIKFLAALVANSGTVVVTGDASAPVFYIIDDLGDQI